MNYYLSALKNYANFNGRARRKEYWMFVLFNMLFGAAAIILDNILGTATEGLGYGVIYIIYMLAIIIPSLAVMVRRLHDIGKSGGWFFISFIPIVGAIWLLILLCKEGQVEDNQYGVNPKLSETQI